MIDVNRLLTQVLNGPSQAGGTPATLSDTIGAVARRFGSVEPDPQASRTEQPASAAQPGTAGLAGTIGALGAGALAGGLAGTLFGSKRMRAVAGTALQVGAVAAIGGLAYKAYQNYSQGKPIVPQGVTDLLGSALPQSAPPADTDPGMATWVPARERSEQVAMLLLRTMVAASASDGHLDAVEHGRIRRQLAASELNEEEQLVLSRIMLNPPRIDELAADATTPELRAEVYTAARLAIDADTPAENDWLNDLAAALKLAPDLKLHLDAINAPARWQAA